jgi:hypothetical protein
MSVPLDTRTILAAAGTETPVNPLTLTVTAPVVLLYMKYSFLLAGTTKLVLAPPVPVNSINMFLAVAEAPLVIARVVVAPVETAWVT